MHSTFKEHCIAKIKEVLSDKTKNGRPIDHSAVERMYKNLDGLCYICNLKSPKTLVAFFPKNSEDFGGLLSKQRVLFYVLCDTCAQVDDIDLIAESKMLQTFNGLN